MSVLEAAINQRPSEICKSRAGAFIEEAARCSTSCTDARA